MCILVLIVFVMIVFVLVGVFVSVQIGNVSLLLDIEVDYVEVFDVEYCIVWWGNVNVVQGDSVLCVVCIDVYYIGIVVDGFSGWGDIDCIEVVENVFYIILE